MCGRFPLRFNSWHSCGCVHEREFGLHHAGRGIGPPEALPAARGASAILYDRTAGQLGHDAVSCGFTARARRAVRLAERRLICGLCRGWAEI